MADSHTGETPTQALQIEAKKVMDQAERRIKAAEQALRSSGSAAERIEAQRYIKEAHAEMDAAKKKYGWVFDWQKSSAAGGIASAATTVGTEIKDAAGDAGHAIRDAGSKLNSEAAAVKKHVVKKGESLSLIAKHYTGDVKKWKELYEKNKATVGSNPDLIQPGMELIIPWEGV